MAKLPTAPPSRGKAKRTAVKKARPTPNKTKALSPEPFEVSVFKNSLPLEAQGLFSACIDMAEQTYPMPSWSATATAEWILPPLSYQGKFYKGVLLSNAVDALCALYPFLPDLFFLVSDSLSPLPLRSIRADAITTGLQGDWSREALAWQDLLAEAQERAPQSKLALTPKETSPPLLWMGTAYRVDESQTCGPAPALAGLEPSCLEDFPLLTYSSMSPQSHLTDWLDLLIAYREKFKTLLKMRVLVNPSTLDLTLKGLSQEQASFLGALIHRYPDWHQYLSFVPNISPDQIPLHYFHQTQIFCGSEATWQSPHPLLRALACQVPVLYAESVPTALTTPELAPILGPPVSFAHPEKILWRLAERLIKRFANPQTPPTDYRENIVSSLSLWACHRRLFAPFAHAYEGLAQGTSDLLASDRFRFALWDAYGLTVEDWIYRKAEKQQKCLGLPAIHEQIKQYFGQFEEYLSDQLENRGFLGRLEIPD